MFILLIGITCIMFGYIVLAITEVFPFMRIAYMHWFATIFFILPYIYTVFRMKVNECYKQADKVPLWKQLVYYLRRDNHVVPLEGERAFPGESFLDIPELGLFEFLGKDCVYTWGEKKIIWGMENVNFSPDPRYWNLTHLLWSIGFQNSDELKNVLAGNNLDTMGKVYMRMLEYDNEHGVRKLITEMEDYNKKTIDFKPTKKEIKKIDNKDSSKIDIIHDMLDKIPKIRLKHKKEVNDGN